MRIAALIVAAGRGSRATTGLDGVPKQYALLNGRAVLAHALSAFETHPAVTDSLVVVHANDADLYAQCLNPAPAAIRRHAPVVGGASRQESVARGLAALKTVIGDSEAIVLIHDAARPFVSHATISAVIAATGAGHGAIAATPVADTLKRAAPRSGNTESEPSIASTVAREGLWQAETPQAFMLDDIAALHATAASGAPLTDDAALAEAAGYPVALIASYGLNRKITTAADLALAERIVGRDSISGASDTMAWETRTGSGFDVHRFASGDHVWLGGVKIPHSARLDGHSDADVALHALTDALLGTIGDGDIGQHFPPSDPRWRGAASIQFVTHARDRVVALGGVIVNVDITILAEAPKIGPHRQAMQVVIGEALGLTGDRIGIKATTMEGLGFIGREEGIAAMATASVRLPAKDTM